YYVVGIEIYGMGSQEAGVQVSGNSLRTLLRIRAFAFLANVHPCGRMRTFQGASGRRIGDAKFEIGVPVRDQIGWSSVLAAHRPERKLDRDSFVIEPLMGTAWLIGRQSLMACLFALLVPGTARLFRELRSLEV